MGAANAMNRVRLHRWFMEKLLGVHRDKLLPDFASTTFEKWAAQSGKLSDETGHETVSLSNLLRQNNGLSNWTGYDGSDGGQYC